MRTDENQLWWAQSSVQGGDTVSGTTSETIFASKPNTIPADGLVVGDVLRFLCSGIFSTQTLAVATFTLRVKLGTTDIMTVSGLSVGALALTNSPWVMTGELHVRSIGGSGSVEGSGSATLGTGAITQIASLVSSVSPVTIDTTADMQLQISAQMSNLTAGNSITLRRFMVEKLRYNP